MKNLYCIIVIMLLVIFPPSLVIGYQPWSENVFQYVKKNFGVQAEKRYRFLHKLILENQNASIDEKLKLVNNTLNNLPWIADKRHWESADYWATPTETISTFGGDCEDIAVAKWLMLRHLGIPKKNLALAYVRVKRTNEPHIVLLYIKNPDLPIEKRSSLVLDSYIKTIQKGSDRNDLWAIYATDTDGTVVLFLDNGVERTIKGVYKGKKHRKLDDLKERIKEDIRLFKKLNGGVHPLSL